MRLGARILLALLLVPLLGGCLTRWQIQEIPEISGVVTVDGVPLAATPVRVVSWLGRDGNPYEDAKVVATTTDAQGTFAVAPVVEQDWFIILGPVDRGNHWALQLFHEGRWRTAWRGVGVGMAPDYPVHADCDLTRPVEYRDIADNRYDHGEGFCLLAPLPATHEVETNR